MAEIKFLDMINVSDEKHLKIVFNSDYDYNPKDLSDYHKKKLLEYDKDSIILYKGETEKKFNWLEIYQNAGLKTLQNFTALNNTKLDRFSDDDIAFIFVEYGGKDWLLVDAFRVIDGGKSPVSVDKKYMSKYAPLFGRLVVSYEEKRGSQITRRYSKKLHEQLVVKTILRQPYNEIEEEFPGYDNVDISWSKLNRVIKLDTWRTALENQKAVYLITDTLTGKRYVGSATSEEGMLLSRWKTYAKNGHGGNKYLVELVKKESLEYVKRYFRYSILDIYKSKVDDDIVRDRETWWKKVLLTRHDNYPDFGYNDN